MNPSALTTPRHEPRERSEWRLTLHGGSDVPAEQIDGIESLDEALELARLLLSSRPFLLYAQIWAGRALFQSMTLDDSGIVAGALCPVSIHSRPLGA